MTNLFLKISICVFLKILNNITILTTAVTILMAVLLKTIISGKKKTKSRSILSKKKVATCLFIICLYNILSLADIKLTLNQNA